MPRGVRKQEGEDLSDSNVDKVIKLLEHESPITKKAACELLSISYNTTRLNKIIETHKETMKFRKDMRKKLRTTPIDTATASEIVSAYLSDVSLADISDRTYRSINVVKNVLTKYNVPIRNASIDYFHPVIIEDVEEDYKMGDLVYAARYGQPATIKGSKHTDKHGMIYSIWLHKSGKFANQPYYELADLRKVQSELSIEMKGLDHNEIITLINEGLRNQKKQEDKRKN